MRFQLLSALALPAIVSSLVIHIPHTRPIPTWVQSKVDSVETNIATKVYSIEGVVSTKISSIETAIATEVHKIKDDITSVIGVYSTWTPPPVPTWTPPAVPDWTPPPVPTIIWDGKVKRDQVEAALNERLVIDIPHPPKIPTVTPPPVPTFEWDTKVKRGDLNARWEFGLDESCVKACTDSAHCTVNAYTTLHDITHCGVDAVTCASDCFSWNNNKKAKRSEKLNARLAINVPQAPTWEEINNAIPAVPDWTAPAVPNIAPPAVPTIVWDDGSNAGTTNAKRANLNARWQFGLDPACVKACADNAHCTVQAYTTLHDLEQCGADAVTCAADCFSWSS